MRHNESLIQKSIVATIRMHPGCRELFAVPNGGFRNIRTAVRLKGEGVLAGVPDLFLPVPTKKHNGLFLEVKTQKGRLSPNQTTFINAMLGRGYEVKVVHSATEALDVVKEYLK